jgi:hypothetical protein
MGRTSLYTNNTYVVPTVTRCNLFEGDNNNNREGDKTTTTPTTVGLRLREGEKEESTNDRSFASPERERIETRVAMSR